MTEYDSRSQADNVFAERVPYPQGGLARRLASSPIFLWRLGFGPLVGRNFLILTHIGRHTGRVRRTALEYHVLDGQIYVFNAWPQSDWFHNVQAEPRVTVQTHQGPMSALAHVLESTEEYAQAFRLVERSPLLRVLLESAGIEVSLSGFLSEKERFQIVSFEPTDLQTPPGLRADLRWFMPAALVLFGLGFIFGNQLRTQRSKPRGFWERLKGSF